MAQGEPANQVEQIPDEDQVSRTYFEVPGDLAPETQFLFVYDKDRDERAESVYWRRYARVIDDVHRRGCLLEVKWADQSPTKKYLGARTAAVRKIRAVKSGRGHWFEVIHYPQNGDRAHAHVTIVRAGGNVKKLSTNDRLELASLIVQCFEGYQTHNC